jgi:HK97 gp10 family phage protein
MANKYTGRVKARLVRSLSFTNKLKELRTATAQAMAPAMEKAAKVVVERMQYLVPVGPTGNLKRSIAWEFYSGRIRATDIENETRVIITAGSEEAPYAIFVEFGKHGKPFFYPAYRASRPAVKRIISDGVRNAVRGVART